MKSLARETWFVEEGGTEKLAALASRLQVLILDRVNSDLQSSYEAYTPWMSFEEEGPDLRFLYTQRLPKILKDPETLAILASAFEDSSGIPLGRLKFDSMHSDQFIWDGLDPAPETFIGMIEEALDLYLGADKNFASRWNSIVQGIVPLRITGQFSDNRAAFSSHLLRGAVFRAIPKESDPFWRLDLAVDLAHELGHQALILYQSADSIIASDLSTQVFSGIRRTERPSIMSFHAAAALAYIIEFLTSLFDKPQNLQKLSDTEKSYAEKELADARSQMRETLEACRVLEFTSLGDKLFSEFESLIR